MKKNKSSSSGYGQHGCAHARASWMGRQHTLEEIREDAQKMARPTALTAEDDKKMHSVCHNE